VITPTRQLKYILHEALQAFIHVLNKYSLKDLTRNKDDLRQLLIFKYPNLEKLDIIFIFYTKTIIFLKLVQSSGLYNLLYEKE